MPQPLEGQVALVAGATRGAGRGIARELAAAGATVWCTGRSTRQAPATPGRPETIEETAELIHADGGQAVALRVDHSDEAEVESLAAQVGREAGRLDVLVNDIWGGDSLIDWNAKFWALDVSAFRRVVDQAIFTHVVTARHLAPLMVEAGRGLIVEVTDGEMPGYRGNLTYDFAKASAIRLAYGMAWDLVGTGVTALALTPGFLRSEAILDGMGVTEATWREAVAKEPEFAWSETPRYIGRAVAALAGDPKVARKAGLALSVGMLADEYGFEDVDGARPHFWRNADHWLDGEFANEGKLTPKARWMGRARYAQIHAAPQMASKARAFAERLGLADLPPALGPAGGG